MKFRHSELPWDSNSMHIKLRTELIWFDMIATKSLLLKCWTWFLASMQIVTQPLKTTVYWFPFRAWISIKINLLIFNVYSGSSPVYISLLISLCSESFSRRNLSMLILSYPSLIFNTKKVVFPSLDLQNLLMLNIYSGSSPVCMSLLVSLCSESQCKIYQCWFRSILYYHTLTFNPENVVFPSLDLRKGIVYPKAFVVQQLRHS